MTHEQEETNGLGGLCGWESGPDPAHHAHFLRSALELLVDKAVLQSTDRNSRVVEWVQPDDLKKRLHLTLEDDPVTQGDLLKYLDEVISLDVYGLVGQWVTDALNPSVYTYEVAPVFTLMEFEVLSEMAKHVGYEEHDGLFSPGGSISNMYGMLLARYYRFPEIKKQGITGLGRLVAFTSIDAHYSVVKSAITLGLGSDNLILVNVDENGRMDVNHLKECITKAREEGGVPFIVCATAGTTVLGAYDPIERVSQVCQIEGLWLHVDAAWGVFLTRHVGLLKDCNSASAAYLFQRDKFYDTSYDTGDKHLQCGRRADVLKFWTMWKAKGTKGLTKHIEKLFTMSKLFADKIRSRDGFTLLLEPECTNVCFWYAPPSLRGHEDNPDYTTRLHAVAPRIKERMVKEGTMMITYQPLRERHNFFRLVLQNSQVNEDDIDYFVRQIEIHGSDL
ncbi:Acidic amino acid decarboxylase GADL1-like 3 [Homarus americanus]|uniref:Acidic amino acid decarboxylase GADL1-like 3 n=1 Tax=Homarus americanus TaxID=6706 RepID=A0A8J5JI71_HOMAM|nr:Acidic amino acid decarboxylase GADL1-like 3 [Homarus americanus]